MPILVRPVREQLEHDRIIRLLEAKWRRKFKVEANPGDERNAGVKGPAGTVYPDLVLTEEGGRKPKALIEVETSESVNHLEAMSQWANLAKARTSLLLFVPAGAVEAARRLASENAIRIAELWTYLVLGDQVRFTSVFRDGSEPADLIEKVEMFTTERAAPAPRPAPAEVVEPPPAAAAAAAEPERPRKLAVKAGAKPADGVPAKPPAIARTTAAKAAAPAKASAPAKAAAPAKPGPAAKTVAPPPPPPVKAAKAEASKPGKPEASKVEPAKAEVVKAAKAPTPAPAKLARPAEKKVEKPAARKAPARKVEKKAAPKPAPARKAAPKAAPRAAAKKAAPARPAARAVKKSPSVKASRPASKRR